MTMFFNKLRTRQPRNRGITEHQLDRLKSVGVHKKTNVETLADYRTRFRLAPIGVWSGVVGTASVVTNEVWEFLADGTGSCVAYGCFGASRGVMQFEWKSEGDFSLLCRVIKNPWEDYPGQDAEQNAEKNDDELPADWETIEYDFQVIHTDCGSQVAMCSVVKGLIQDHFWSNLFALSYSGPSQSAE